MNYSMYLLAGLTALSAVPCSGGAGQPTYVVNGSREPVVDGRESGGSTNSGGTGSAAPSTGTGNGSSSNGSSGSGNSGNGNSGNGGTTEPSPTTPPTTTDPAPPTTQGSCATLNACCPTLGDVAQQCTDFAAAGDENACAATLKRLQDAGSCN